MNLTPIKKICLGAKLVCNVCGKSEYLDPLSISVYLSRSWKTHCCQTMRLVAKTEQEKERDDKLDYHCTCPDVSY